MAGVMQSGNCVTIRYCVYCNKENEGASYELSDHYWQQQQATGHIHVSAIMALSPN